MISWKFVDFQIRFVVLVDRFMFTKWLRIEFFVEVWNCRKIKVLLVDCFTCLLFIIMSNQIACIPWLESWNSVQFTKSTFVVNKSNIDFFISGNFCRLISCRLFNSIWLFIPISHEDTGIVTITDLMHIVFYRKNFSCLKWKNVYRTIIKIEKL